MTPATATTHLPRQSHEQKIKASIHYLECENEILLSQIFLTEEDEKLYRSNCKEIQALRKQLTGKDYSKTL